MLKICIYGSMLSSKTGFKKECQPVPKPKFVSEENKSKLQWHENKCYFFWP